MLRFATVNGAHHLPLGRRTGSLTPGKDADIVLLDVAPLNSAPRCGGVPHGPQGVLLDTDLDQLRRELEASRDHPLPCGGSATRPVHLS
ncbi:amidohydrolase family protein [Streptomyces sp. NPDC091217]|uniref:amidohydrolase family protein n=1 Tax=Streptomyces sp. NPDC091217 TaxID=3365975 RepID=UPI0038158251